MWRARAGLGGQGLGSSLAPAIGAGQWVLMVLAAVLAIARIKAPRLPVRWTTLGALADSGAVAALLALCILAVAVGGYSPFLYYRF
jgi:hypothetical protein